MEPLQDFYDVLSNYTIGNSVKMEEFHYFGILTLQIVWSEIYTCCRFLKSILVLDISIL